MNCTYSKEKIHWCRGCDWRGFATGSELGWGVVESGSNEDASREGGAKFESPLGGCSLEGKGIKATLAQEMGMDDIGSNCDLEKDRGSGEKLADVPESTLA